MKTTQFAALLAVGLLISQASAAVVTELEANGTAVNNSVGTAQAISGSSFTLPVPSSVFDPGYSTATVNGLGGGADVDFYSFQANAGGLLIDIDDDPFIFDTVLSLFDSNGTLIAFDDDSFPEDPGTGFGYQSFIGEYTLTSSGTYYVAVTQYSNFANATFSGTTYSDLIRPDGAFGGSAVEGATFGDSSFGVNGTQDGLTYTMHISLENAQDGAVPEPATLTIWGLGAIGCAVAAYRRRKQTA